MTEDSVAVSATGEAWMTAGGSEGIFEDFDDEELLYLKSLADHAGLPMTVKIGGPEARRDIRFCLNNNIDKILAPMIESVYALDLFVNTATSLASKPTPKLAINLESYLAYSSLD